MKTVLIILSIVLIVLHYHDKDIELIKEKQKLVDISIKCMVEINRIQDRNSLDIYLGSQVEFPGQYYSEVPECEAYFKAIGELTE